MKVLKTTINEPEELAERFLPDMNNSGIFIPRSTELKVGEDVCVWCVLRSHSAELHMMGVVYWIRHRTGQQRQTAQTQRPAGRLSQRPFLPCEAEIRHAFSAVAAATGGVSPPAVCPTMPAGYHAPASLHMWGVCGSLQTGRHGP